MKTLLIAAILLFGCSVDKQAAKKTSWLLGHDKLSEVCARIYPNVDSISKGDTVTTYDTLYLDSNVYIRDTVIMDGQTIIKEKKCPPVQVITKTAFVHDTIYRSNTAEVERWKSEAHDKDKQIKEKDDIVLKQQVKIDKNDWWKTAALITWFAILLGIITRLFIYKKPI